VTGSEGGQGATVDTQDAGELRNVVVDSIRHVLSAYGIDVADPITLDDAPDPDQMVALIGFTGNALGGTLTLIAPSDLVRRSCPAIRNEWQTFDWAGELANLMLGRVKVGLAARGVEVESSTPRVMRFSQLHGLPSTERTVCATCFSTGDGPMRVSIRAVCSNDHPLFNMKPVEDNSRPEGEVLFFD
jgi:hypothetical protein